MLLYGKTYSEIAKTDEIHHVLYYHSQFSSKLFMAKQYNQDIVRGCKTKRIIANVEIKNISLNVITC